MSETHEKQLALVQEMADGWRTGAAHTAYSEGLRLYCSSRAAALAAVLARLGEYEKALEPFASFGRYILNEPRRRGSYDDEIYGWDNRDDAKIRQSDLINAAKALSDGFASRATGGRE